VIICRTVAELRALRASLVSPLGLVPTMGALHAGHESLVERARAECASVVASIFVNPLQFGPKEDFADYPRTFDADCALLERHGVDVLFAPADSEMYPQGSQVTVDPGALALHLEGERRPDHFRGVATVVLKLFNIASPDRAYFGRKDAQQLAVVRRMTADLDLPVEVVACATVRASDGIALSSRNKYLNDAERRDAAGLSRALRMVVEAVEREGAELGAALRAGDAQLGSLRKDYLAVVDAAQFVPLETLPPNANLLVVGAAYCGAVRLIDNMELHTP
jgi:pantoate--beta-alanine ligase